jgi:hypothetical protein
MRSLHSTMRVEVSRAWDLRLPDLDTFDEFAPNGWDRIEPMGNGATFIGRRDL